MTHDPVLKLVAISAIGVVIAIALLLSGYPILSVLVFGATVLLLCALLGLKLRRSNR